MKGKRRDDFVDFVCDQLAPLGVVRAKSMFGGYGIYVDDWFCAIIANDTLWFKVDDHNRADFETLGTGPFKPFDDKPMVMSYYEVPADILDDRREILVWGEKAIAAAKRAKKLGKQVKKSAATAAKCTTKSSATKPQTQCTKPKINK